MAPGPVIDLRFHARLKARHLALVVALDAHRSLRRAAAAIAVTQPAATKLLHDLEDALDAPLFERHAWGMSPTPYGETLIRYARGALNDLAQAQADIAAQRAGVLGSLRVGGVTGSVPRFIAPAIGALRAAHPRVRVYALVNTGEVLVDALRRGELDVAVTPRPPDDDLAGLETRALADEALTIVARSGHPLARRRSIALARLGALPWIVPPAGGPLRRDFDALHAAAGVRPPTDLIETVSIVATLALLQSSDAVSLLPEGLARHYETPGLLARLAARLPGAGTRYEVMTRANRALAPVAQAIVAALVAIAAGRGPATRAARRSP
ncbi:MAG: LysR family transcriptional regulator [Betaproteobacteria bacterium]